MGTYIQLYHGLENFVIQHLMTIADGDIHLTFDASSYKNSLVTDGVFLQVIFAPATNVSLGGELLDSVVSRYQHNGDVLICPRRYSDEISVQEEPAPIPVYKFPGSTQFVQTADASGWDALITYDANRKAPDSDDEGPDYVIKSADGRCSDVPRHVILFHELCHTVLTRVLPLTTSDPLFEQHCISIENQYRSSFGLPLRSTDTSDLVLARDIARAAGLCP